MPAVDPELLTLLAAHDFPGNVRELRFLILDALSCSDSKNLNGTRIKEHLGSKVAAHAVSTPSPAEGLLLFGPKMPTIKQGCKEMVNDAMHRSGNNQVMAARLLGISRQALNKRLNNMRNDSLTEE